MTGIAGPGGGSEEKPVGTVWLAVDVLGSITALVRRYPGDRDEIRRRAAQTALDMVRLALLPGWRSHEGVAVPPAVAYSVSGNANESEFS